MSIGATLIGLALAVIVAAYLARPFRPTTGAADVERTIERWVAQARADRRPQEPNGPARHCTHCGRRARADDRFCAGCGEPLPEEME